MWTRKELKNKARKQVKQHYWRLVFICIIIAYFAGGYALSGTTSLITAYDEEEETSEAMESNLKEGQKALEVAEEFVRNINSRETESAAELESDLAEGEDNIDAVDEVIGGEGRSSNQKYEKKYNRGILSALFNNIVEADSLLFGILNAVNQMAFNDRIMYGIVLILGNILTVLIWVFIKNPLRVCECRCFMESVVYEKISVEKLLFVFRVRKLKNVAAIMFLKELYTGFWWFTIFGGIIKHYSYSMIPCILAENPDIGRKEAFRLSMAMMKGNKWKAFMLDVSFSGWILLSLMTGGLAGIFYINPYLTAARTQLYFRLREEAIDKQVSHVEYLNDIYLVQKPQPLEGGGETLIYPTELYTIPVPERRREMKHDFRRNYSFWSLVMLFFTFSFIGWLWEMSLSLPTEGFVNRGVQHGPWLPIYGCGSVLILFLLKRFREHQLITFFAVIVVCGVLEYFTGYVLEVIHKGEKWWDYSGYFLNINGRVCAEGLLVFGLGGCMVIYYAAPLFDDLYQRIPYQKMVMLSVVLMVVFSIDVVYSGKYPNKGTGITDYVTQSEKPDVLANITQNELKWSTNFRIIANGKSCKL